MFGRLKLAVQRLLVRLVRKNRYCKRGVSLARLLSPAPSSTKLLVTADKSYTGQLVDEWAGGVPRAAIINNGQYCSDVSPPALLASPQRACFAPSLRGEFAFFVCLGVSRLRTSDK